MGYAERLVRQTPALPAGVGDPAYDAGPVLTRLGQVEPQLWLLTLVGFVADTGLTVYGLEVGLNEANPLVVGAAAVLGPLLGITLLKCVSLGIGLCFVHLLRRRHRPLVPLALGTTWVTAALLNTVNIAVA
jgi:hypothetical protein